MIQNINDNLTVCFNGKAFVTCIAEPSFKTISCRINTI